MLTTPIIIITVLISIIAFQSPRLMDKCIFSPYAIKHNREYHRFITSGFLHANWVHLLINMFVLYSFSQIVEQGYSQLFGNKGMFYFLILYIGAIIISDIPSYKKHQNNGYYKSLGASGAVSAVVFASLVFQPLAPIYIWGLIGIPGIILGILYLVYSAQMTKRSADNINHDAHFYGAVFGFAYTILLEPKLFLHFINQLTSWL